MTINEGGQQATINVTGNSSMIGFGSEIGYCLIAVPMGFDLVAMLIEVATAEAITPAIGVEILESLFKRLTSGN